MDVKNTIFPTSVQALCPNHFTIMGSCIFCHSSIHSSISAAYVFGNMILEFIEVIDYSDPSPYR